MPGGVQFRFGYTKFGGYLLGGMEEWNNKGLPITELAQMSVHELQAALPPKDLQVLDVRTPGERQDGHVPGSTYIFLPELEKKAKRLDKTKPVTVYCDSGYRASLAASLLLRMSVYQSLRAASQDRHLPAFQRCVQRSSRSGT